MNINKLYRKELRIQWTQRYLNNVVQIVELKQKKDHILIKINKCVHHVLFHILHCTNPVKYALFIKTGIPVLNTAIFHNMLNSICDLV